MKWTIEYVKDGAYFKAINEGIYEIGDSAKLYGDILSSEFWQPNTPIMIDNRLLDFKNVNYDVISQASINLSKNRDQIAAGKIAYLVESSLGYGVSRQFQMLLADKTSTEIEIFRDEQSAVEWLTRKPDLEI